jgi:two-component system, chemotaxis family, CheB/CheR fusion protein
MNHRLLIADDIRGSADILAYLLKREGYETAVAYGGEQAVETAVNFDPDTLILDLDMPDLDGFQVATRLRALPTFSSKRFIALTSHAEQPLLEEASKVSFDGYMVKPFDVHVLKTMLADPAE